MSLRTWLGSILILALLIVGLKVVETQTFPPPPLRSEHSEAAALPPSGQVAIADGGKTFHKPGCRYLHGKARLMDGRDAVQEGYAPCIRCERAALRN